jgi:hypothetical protein
MTQRLSGSALARLFVLLLAACPAAHAQTAQAQAGGSIDLFKDLDSIRLTTAVGGPLDQQGGTAPQLFVGDLKRFNRFEQNLTDALAQKLSTCGLFVDQEAQDELSVEVFGRLEKLQQCTPRYVYMIQAKVRNSKLKAGRAKVDIPLRPVIGIADEAGLERALIDAAVAAIAAELRNCHKPAAKSGGR